MHQGTDSWDFVRVTCPVTSLRTLPAFLPRALLFVAASHVTLRTLLSLLPRALRFVAASHVTLRTLLALLPRALRCVAAAILVRFFGFVSRIFFSGSAATLVRKGGRERGYGVREIDRSRARLFDELPRLLSISYTFRPPPVRACAHHRLSLLPFLLARERSSERALCCSEALPDTIPLPVRTHSRREHIFVPGITQTNPLSNTLPYPYPLVPNLLPYTL